MLGWFAETTLVAAGLAALALVLGAARWFRLAPEARHALWLVVLVKFLLPPVVAWPWAASDRPTVPSPPTLAARPSFPTVPEPFVAAPPALVEPEGAAGPLDIVLTDPSESPAGSVGGDPPTPPVVALDPPRRAATTPADPAPAEPASPLPVARPGLRWRSLLLGGWLVGTTVVAAWGGARIHRVRRRIRRATPAEPWLRDEVAAVSTRLGIVAPPRVLVVAGLPTPLLWCLGRPRLVVPHLLDELEPAARAGLLAHELAHLVRRDHWVVWLELAAGLIWWWNPVFRFARRRLRDEAEAACDARVVRAFPTHRFAYAEALVQVCERHAGTVPPLPALGIGGPGAARTLEARLLMILRDPIRPPSRWLPLSALALLALSLPTWTLGQQDPARPADPPKAEASKVDAPQPPRSGSAVGDVVEDVTKRPPDIADPSKPSQPAQRGAKTADPTDLPGESNPPPADGKRSPSRLQARRNIQAAEVARAEAERDRLQAIADRDAAHAKRNIVSQGVADDAQASLKVADAAVAIEKAKLAEADMPLDPADLGPTLNSRRDPRDLPVLQARRAIQIAEVERVEAQLRLAEAVSARNNALNKRIPNSVASEEIQKAEGESMVAKAVVAREKARLAEAEALLDQAKPPRAAEPSEATSSGKPPAVLSDYRDQVELAELQVEVKRVEMQRAGAKADRARRSLDARTPLAREGRITQNEIMDTRNDLAEAQDEVKTKEIETREAELRLKQARRRANFEEVRLKRLAERTRGEMDRTARLFRSGVKTVRDVEDIQGRYDDLMFQLDPNYGPAPESTREPAQPRQPDKSPR